jgi:hypothetical protein
MSHFARILTAALLILATGNSYGQTYNVDPFHKVVISPFIEATFIEGDQEQVVINSILVDLNKLQVETRNGTLRLYLEGAKEIPKSTRETRNTGRDLYPTHAVTATIYYKKLDALSLRGEEQFTCESPLSAKNFTLTLYGESVITFKKVQFDELHTTIYGESSVDIQSGSVNKQSYVCYGEGKVNSTAISGEQARLTAYGEAQFNMNVSDRIKLTSFGEAKLRYKGNPQIVKGIHIGEVDVARID